MPLGWHISVYRKLDNKSVPATSESIRGNRLAVWQSRLNGIDWLTSLTEEKKAIDLGGNGYPWLFTALANNIIPIIRTGDIPEARTTWVCEAGDIVTSEWNGKTTKDVEKMDACDPDEWLLIVAWDES